MANESAAISRHPGLCPGRHLSACEDGDLGRGNHQGQRSRAPHQQAGHKTASDKIPITSKSLALQEPSTQDKAAVFRCGYCRRGIASHLRHGCRYVAVNIAREFIKNLAEPRNQTSASPQLFPTIQSQDFAAFEAKRCPGRPQAEGARPGSSPPAIAMLTTLSPPYARSATRRQGPGDEEATGSARVSIQAGSAGRYRHQ